MMVILMEKETPARYLTKPCLEILRLGVKKHDQHNAFPRKFDFLSPKGAKKRCLRLEILFFSMGGHDCRRVRACDGAVSAAAEGASASDLPAASLSMFSSSLSSSSSSCRRTCPL